MAKSKNLYNKAHYFLAWAVHAFTASAACVGLLTLVKIYEHDYQKALWLMAIAVFIDAIDGTLARLVGVKRILPGMDGALLDNIVDYLNYVITPCFFLFVKQGMLPHQLSPWIVVAIIIASAYQFCQADAKTADHFFKGFPCYWNVVVFYLFIFNTGMICNALVLSLLCILVFVPIKYVYPSRLDYLTRSKLLKLLMHVLSLAYAACSAIILWTYPAVGTLSIIISVGYISLYMLLSFYRTYNPIVI